MEKVTLPRDVAEAIEELRKCDWSEANLLNAGEFIKSGRTSEVDLGTEHYGYPIAKYLSADFHSNYPKYIIALTTGYTVEQTPEEKVREYFGNAKNEYTHLTPHYDADECDIEIAMRYKYSLGKAVAIKKTLNLLGISIEGINA